MNLRTLNYTKKTVIGNSKTYLIGIGFEVFDKNVVHNPVNETDPMADKKNETPAVTLA